MDIEKSFISKVILERCSSDVFEENISDNAFVEHSAIWKWLKEKYREHGDIPSEELFQHKWPDFILNTVDGPISFLIEELRTRRVQTLLLESLQQQANLLKTGDPNAALDVARSALIKLDQEIAPSTDINLLTTTKQRNKEYFDINSNDGLTGLPYPWPCLNEATLGMNKEDLILVAARNKVGKTFALLIMAMHQWSLGHPVLIISREMSAKQIIRRCDAILSKLDYGRFRAGLLNMDEMERWEKTLKSMEQSDVPLWVVGNTDGSGGVSEIIAKVRKYKPSVLYLDGVYLVSDDRKAKTSWERISNVSQDLKRLAQKMQIPVVISHQFSLAGTGDKGSEDTLKFGDISMWMDAVIGLFRSEENKASNEMQFKLLKNREGAELEFITNWDLARMNFDVYKTGNEFVDASRYNSDNIEY